MTKNHNAVEITARVAKIAEAKGKAPPPLEWIELSISMKNLSRDYIAELQRVAPNARSADLIVDAMGFLLLKMAEERADRLKLEARLKAVEESGGFNYRGVWREGAVYNKGSFVTHQGGLWHANEANSVRPGGGEAGVWTLAVKRGKDAK